MARSTRSRNSSISRSTASVEIVHNRVGPRLDVTDQRGNRYWIRANEAYKKKLIGEWTLYVPIRTSCICREGVGHPFVWVTYQGYKRERVYIHDWPQEEVRKLRSVARENSQVLANFRTENNTD